MLNIHCHKAIEAILERRVIVSVENVVRLTASAANDIVGWPGGVVDVLQSVVVAAHVDLQGGTVSAGEQGGGLAVLLS